MPNDFIGGGSKDTPHLSEGECYVSKNASGLIVVITLRASQTFFNEKFKLFFDSDALRSEGGGSLNFSDNFIYWTPWSRLFILIVISDWTKISLIFWEDGEWSPTTIKMHGDFIVPLPLISTTAATAKPNGLVGRNNLIGRNGLVVLIGLISHIGQVSLISPSASEDSLAWRLIGLVGLIGLVRLLTHWPFLDSLATALIAAKPKHHGGSSRQ